MNRPGVSIVLLLLTCLAACAPQTSTFQSPSGLKCTIDLKSVCQQYMQNTKPSDITKGGADENAASFEQNSAPTTDVVFTLGQGDREADLICSVNTRTLKVIYARLSSTSSPTDADIAKLRINGICAEGASQ